MIAVSLIIPCYNEAEIVEGTLGKATAFLDSTGRAYEIVIGDDGSRDDTPRIVREAAARDPRIRLVRTEENRGKGAILTKALLDARGDVLAFIDADLEIDVSSLAPLLSAIDAGADIAIGSKVLHPDWKERPLRRRLATRGYNVLVNFLLRSRLGDHQAGIKAFRREPLREILLAMDNARWTWDTELLVAAQSAGLLIREVPVTTTFQRPSKVSLLRQPMEMAIEVLRLYASGTRVRGRADRATAAAARRGGA